MQGLDPKLLRVLWESGRLEWLLDECQRGLLAEIRANHGLKFVLNCSRRLGKSYLMLADADMYARQNPGSELRWAAPTAKQIRSIVTPIMGDLHATCPRELRPRWVAQDGFWLYPNESKLWVAGCDSRADADKLRGPKADRWYVDEAGSIPELQYVVQDVLQPQTLTTGGSGIVASTPPESLDHPFRDYALSAQIGGCYAHRTIYDNPRITPEVIAQYMEESGGPDSTTWRREYMAEFVTDDNRAIVPEWRHHGAACIGEHPRPPYFDAYVGMDLGYNDLTVVLFGYWDFIRTTMVIEDEIVLKNMRTASGDSGTAALAADVKRKIDTLYPGMKLTMVSDNDLIVINDLASQHGLYFTPAEKHNREEQGVNVIRMMVQREELRIHPRCTTLIQHMESGIWNAQRTDFARPSDRSHHYDAIPALCYMVRRVNRRKNPYPEWDPHISPDTHFMVSKPSQASAMVKGIYGRRAEVPQKPGQILGFRKRW